MSDLEDIRHELSLASENTHTAGAQLHMIADGGELAPVSQELVQLASQASRVIMHFETLIGRSCDNSQRAEEATNSAEAAHGRAEHALNGSHSAEAMALHDATQLLIDTVKPTRAYRSISDIMAQEIMPLYRCLADKLGQVAAAAQQAEAAAALGPDAANAVIQRIDDITFGEQL